MNKKGHEESVNVILGEVQTNSEADRIFTKISKSLRLIRLIRIIKLYKYITKSGEDKNEDSHQNKKKKKQKVGDQSTEINKDEEAEETLFKKETDPTKLGKALIESINRGTIIGVLLMLMVLPLLRRNNNDFSGEHALREVFWFGRSNCINRNDENAFFCDQNDWLTEEGWYE